MTIADKKFENELRCIFNLELNNFQSNKHIVLKGLDYEVVLKFQVGYKTKMLKSGKRQVKTFMKNQFTKTIQAFDVVVFNLNRKNIDSVNKLDTTTLVNPIYGEVECNSDKLNHLNGSVLFTMEDKCVKVYRYQGDIVSDEEIEEVIRELNL
ncbi:TPA: hypothetical protein ACH6AG_000009 [Campylobacter jejuni]